MEQNRGFREGALVSSFTIEHEHHTLKFGGDLRINNIRESFRFAEPDELPEFDLDFNERRRSTEAAAFVQDHIRLGNFAATVGLRMDHYRLLIQDTALSPRVGLSYYMPGADLLLRASYDRIFQPPPTENLLLSSAAAGLGLDDVEGALAVPASRANFFEVGFRKPLGNHLRADVSHYWRTFRNSIDDDVFLNTGLSFPITFDTARVQGTEIRLEMPRWRKHFILCQLLQHARRGFLSRYRRTLHSRRRSRWSCGTWFNDFPSARISATPWRLRFRSNLIGGSGS